jgi:hypothetical protein
MLLKLFLALPLVYIELVFSIKTMISELKISFEKIVLTVYLRFSDEFER